MSYSQEIITSRTLHNENHPKGRHYDFIKSKVETCFTSATLKRVHALNATPLKIQGWHKTAPASHHENLKAANIDAWNSQNQVDRLIDKLQDVYSFAAPLLQAKLKEMYGVDDDVKTTYLRFYLPKDRPWYVIDTLGGVTTRTVSLLDAALHNFAPSETFESDSDFITKPDERGHFDIKPIKSKMTIEQFQALCRELDIGALYTAHLKSVLLVSEPVAKTVLQYKVNESQKSAFKAATQLALMTKDISRNAHEVLLGMFDGQQNLTLGGKVVQFCDLCMMDTTLTGIVIVAPIPEERDRLGIGKVIAYVPHDPEHPVKEYASTVDFMTELTRQLRENNLIPSSQMSYRQFFSQFVDQQQRGHFFAGLEQRLTTVTWHQKEPLDQRPSWRETPVANPDLQFSVSPITNDFWQHLYQQKLNKILNDAREIAVSTADADSKARWTWWDNFKQIVSDIFNVALMVLTPFVPGLGELMLAYTAYQLANDVIEGVVDLAEDLWAEGAEHIVGVVSDVVQLIAFAAGAKIAGEFQLKASAFIEGMKPVRLPNGETRLWHPDITPYEHKNLRLPEDSKPDALGLHRHEGKDVLPLDDRHYVVQKESGLHRFQHPTRPEAYAPKLAHNRRGAWRHEGENPLTWEGPKLMKRLGHMTDGLSPRQLENIRLISGIEEDALRRMHVENAEPPLLLEDTVNRFRAIEDIAATTTQIRSGSPIDPSSHWFEQLITELPGWPSDHALRVYERSDLLGASRLYGNANARPERTLNIGLADVMAGRLPERVVRFLDEQQLEALVGPGLSRQAKVQRLRDRLANQVERRKTDIADYIYRSHARSTDRRVQVMQRQYPELPTIIAERLVANTRQDDLRIVDAQQRLPLDLKSRVRECAFETRSTRASEGFFQAERLTADTERLALNALRLNSEALRDLRVEIRDGTAEGPLRCSVGPEDATHVRLLLRAGDGRYEVVDGQHRPLSDAVDFHEALLRALPEQARRSIGYGLGQGQAFKQWIMAKTIAPAQRRTLLLEPSIRPVAELDTSLLLRGPVFSRQPVTVEQRVKNLYPHLREHEVDNFIRSMPSGSDPVQLISDLERELTELENILDAWKTKNTPFEPDNTLRPPREITFIANRLMECFQRKSLVFDERSTHFDKGYALDLSNEFLSFNPELWWKQLPDIRPYLEQISTLNLDGVEISPDSKGLLKDFTRLRHLSARRCQLTRLPDNVASMHLLETLRLSGNHIALDTKLVEQLKHLTRLQTLRLDHNPLRQAPNVARMPRLKVLSLSNTGINTWPDGLLSKDGLLSRHRPKGFFLDLRDNPIKTVPTAVNGSREALLIARARLDIDSLHDIQRQILFQYRDSVGLPRQNTYAPLAANARAKWPVDDDSSLWGANSPGLGTYRAEAWDNLMNEPNSEGFFRIIDSLTHSADFRAGGATRKVLSRRVWELIDAADLDTPLRKELFQTAEQPTTCADASSEVFNTIGIQALASQAYSYSTNAAELEARLVKLGKGAARLQRANDIARADALSRPNRAEEVEIYLAYQTRLASRLGLPWQSERMLYRQMAGVSDAAIDQAYATVLALEEGDGLLDAMLEQPFWNRYLRETHDLRFRSNDRDFEEKLQLLEQRREVGEINEQVYSDSINTLADEKLQLGRSLTRMLLDKHAL